MTDVDRLGERLIAPENNPAAVAATGELLDAVVRAVAGDHGNLTTDERAVLLALARGASDRDLAAQLGVAPSTAHAKRVSALAKLRRLLAAQGHRAIDPVSPERRTPTDEQLGTRGVPAPEHGP